MALENGPVWFYSNGFILLERLQRRAMNLVKGLRTSAMRSS